MKALPQPPCRKRLRTVVAVAYRDHAEKCGGRHVDVACLAEPGTMALLGGKRRQELCRREDRGRKSGRIEFEAASFPRHVSRTVAEPGMAVLNHLVVGDDLLRRLNDGSSERLIFPAFGEEGERHIVASRHGDETAQKVFRKAALALIWIAVGVAMRDGIVERIGGSVLLRETKRCRTDHAAAFDIEKRSFDRLDRYGIAIRGCGERHVLDGAAEADMHFAQVGIEAAEIARCIGEDVDTVLTDAEYPWLRVVRIGGENAGSDERNGRALIFRRVPERPRIVRRAGRFHENAAVMGAPDGTA